MYSSCEKRALVHQCVEINANVTVTPILDHGDPTVSCIKSEVCSGHSCKEKESVNCDSCSESCTFHVSQVLCVEIPICFGVEVDVEKGHIRCGRPDFGPCACKCKNDDKEIAYRFNCTDDCVGEEPENLSIDSYFDIEYTDY